MKNRALSVSVLIASFVLAGCPALPTGPGSENASLQSGMPGGPRLQTPMGTSIPQNDPASGCPDAGVRGKGFLIRFDWTDPQSSVGIGGYEIWVKREGSQLPLVELQVIASEFTYKGCGFVIDRNLTGWEWRVRALSTAGTPGEWSGVGTFQFKPCRLSDGSKCRTTAE
jgi:hypothetical protein